MHDIDNLRVICSQVAIDSSIKDDEVAAELDDVEAKKRYTKLREDFVWAVHKKDQIRSKMKTLEAQFSLEELLGKELSDVYKKHGKIPSESSK